MFWKFCGRSQARSCFKHTFSVKQELSFQNDPFVWCFLMKHPFAMHKQWVFVAVSRFCWSPIVNEWSYHQKCIAPINRCTESFVVRCAIRYLFYNLKNAKNTYGRVLLFKSDSPPWVFFTFSKLYKWCLIAQRMSF